MCKNLIPFPKPWDPGEMSLAGQTPPDVMYSGATNCSNLGLTHVTLKHTELPGPNIQASG